MRIRWQIRHPCQCGAVSTKGDGRACERNKYKLIKGLGSKPDETSPHFWLIQFLYRDLYEMVRSTAARIVWISALSGDAKIKAGIIYIKDMAKNSLDKNY